MVKCKLLGHKPGRERANFGYFGQFKDEFWYIIQECERCGQILTVLWPPKEEILRDARLFNN